MHVCVCLHLYIYSCVWVYLCVCERVYVCLCVCVLFWKGSGLESCTWVSHCRPHSLPQVPCTPSLPTPYPGLCYPPHSWWCKQSSQTPLLKTKSWGILLGVENLFQCFWSKFCFPLDWLAASLKFPSIIAFKNWLNLEGGGRLQQAGSCLQIVWL